MARFLAALVVLAALAAGVLVTWPRLADLEQSTPFAQLVASRVALAALALVAMVLLSLFALIARPLRTLAAGLSLVLLLVAGANVGIAFLRGMGDLDGADATVQAEASELTVLTWNTNSDSVDPEKIAQIARERNAAIIVLPETTATLAVAALSAITLAGGAEYSVHGASLDPSGSDAMVETTVLVRADLGEYALSESDIAGAIVPTLTLRSVDGSGPTIVATHLAPPLPAHMDEWRAGLALVQTRCGDANTILAGDFNATVDHLGDLGRCQDAATVAGAASAGTWPARLPALFGASIDRVLAGGDWRVRDFAVLTGFDHSGSDHRPVVAVLAPR